VSRPPQARLLDSAGCATYRFEMVTDAFAVFV
jgi:hypothetical protein